MSVRRLDPVQPEGFEFTQANLRWAKETIRKYPEGKQASAVIPVLWRAQEQNEGWTTEAAIRYVAELLDMPYIRVYEVATFYTMFQLSPVGKTAHVQVCGTTPCMLRGAEDLIKVCKRKIARNPHQVTEDGSLSWEEVECLGACTNAPMVQIYKDVYEDLTPEDLEHIIDALARGETPKTGPYNGRQCSAPLGELTSLTDPDLYNGKARRAPAKKRAAPKKAPAPTNAARPEPKAKIVSPAIKSPAKKATVARAKAATKKPAKPAGPERLAKPRGAADDLKLISGVGPKLEQTLNRLGFWHFDQIAQWKKADVAIVDDQLSFKGRIDRDEWIKQAKALARKAK